MKQRYAFKNKELQSILENILPEFADAMEMAQPYSTGHGNFILTVRATNWSFRLPSDLFELVPGFDPDDWNAYPKVTPPARQRMRLEILYANPDECGLKNFLGCAFFDGEEWVYANTGKTIEIDPSDDVRFRPWE